MGERALEGDSLPRAPPAVGGATLGRWLQCRSVGAHGPTHVRPLPTPIPNPSYFGEPLVKSVLCHARKKTPPRESHRFPADGHGPRTLPRHGSRLRPRRRRQDPLRGRLGHRRLRHRRRHSATAAGAYATAVGNLANASGNNSAAFGNNARATNTNATALGDGSNANGTASTAVGQAAVANGNNDSVFGQGAIAQTSAGLAVNGASDLRPERQGAEQQHDGRRPECGRRRCRHVRLRPGRARAECHRRRSEWRFGLR